MFNLFKNAHQREIEKQLKITFGDSAKGIENYGKYLRAKSLMMYRTSHFVNEILKGCGK